MLYKTIALGLLEEHPKLHQELRTHGTLLQTMERYASELKTRHDYWKDELHQSQPGSDPLQISSKALELVAGSPGRFASRVLAERHQKEKRLSTRPCAFSAVTRRPISRLARPCWRILVSHASPSLSFSVH